MPPRSTAPTKTSKPRRQFAPHKPFVPTDVNIMERAAAHYLRMAQYDRRPGIKIWARERAKECVGRIVRLKLGAALIVQHPPELVKCAMHISFVSGADA